MIQRHVLLVLAVIMVWQNYAFASNPQCSRLYVSTNVGFAILVERLNSGPQKNLWADQAFDSRTPNFGWWRRHKLKSYSEKVEFLKASKNFENVTYDLWLLLQGPRFESLNWLRLARDPNYENAIRSWVQRQLILHGLKSLEGPLPDRRVKKLQANLSRVFQVNLKGVATVPFAFPRKSDAQIPTELLEKLLVDGIEAHKVELRMLYGEQRSTDYYHALRPFLQILGFVALGLVLEEAEDQIREHQARKNARELMQEVEDINASLDELLIEVQRRKAGRAP